MHTDFLLSKYAIISDQVEPVELKIILSELEDVLESDSVGEIVEFGCYSGTTSLFLQRMLEGKRKLHVYDSFEGLPVKTEKDISAIGLDFEPGKLAASKKLFVNNFKKAGLPLPVIHKAWFKNLSSHDLPDKIAFAFLDGDYYESILIPLTLIWPRLSKGAVVVVDDYHNEALPGASKAVDEWLERHPARLRNQASLAIIHTE